MQNGLFVVYHFVVFIVEHYAAGLALVYAILCSSLLTIRDIMLQV